MGKKSDELKAIKSKQIAILDDHINAALQDEQNDASNIHAQDDGGDPTDPSDPGGERPQKPPPVGKQ